MIRYFQTLLLFILVSLVSYAQEQDTSVSDSLMDMGYDDLWDSVYKNPKNNNLAKRYAKAYLKKGKRDNDTLRIIRGYYSMWITDLFIDNTEKQLSYIDSAIFLAKKSNDQRNVTLSHIKKGITYTQNKDYRSSIKEYSKSYHLAKTNKFKFLASASKHNLALLNVEIGEYQKALVVLKEEYNDYINKNINDQDNLFLYQTISSICRTYILMQETDSTAHYIKLGYQKAIKEKKEDWIFYFNYYKGVNHYNLKNYQASIDSLTKFIPLVKEEGDPIAHYYIGMSYYKTNRIEKGISNLKIMDSIAQSNDIVLCETRNGYETLINYYKAKNNAEKQLKYINRLLQIDSVQRKNYKIISKEINSQYETPKLLKKKQELINSLNKSKSGLIQKLLLAIGIIILISAISLIMFFKHQKFKKNYNLLIDKTKEQTKKEKEKPQTIENISEENVSLIIDGLSSFEEKLDFLTNGLTLKKVALALNTNTTYLSKVINFYKDKNFSSYLNDLRINYILEILPTNSKMQNYTIQALAKEIGYNNSESFSSAFYKRTGIKPSFYIKQLKKETK